MGLGEDAPPALCPRTRSCPIQAGARGRLAVALPLPHSPEASALLSFRTEAGDATTPAVLSLSCPGRQVRAALPGMGTLGEAAPATHAGKLLFTIPALLS